jgi:hypothetical protein
VHITKLHHYSNGWSKFNLNVGGFTIKNCRWHQPTRRIFFPVRYGRRGHRFPVIQPGWGTVARLRQMLESGITRVPRDRRPCTLAIHQLHHSHQYDEGWFVFDFTFRRFTILGCRWQPSSGSIQLPVTYGIDPERGPVAKKRVVCAYGPHINRLRAALRSAHASRISETAPELASV